MKEGMIKPLTTEEIATMRRDLASVKTTPLQNHPEWNAFRIVATLELQQLKIAEADAGDLRRRIATLSGVVKRAAANCEKQKRNGVERYMKASVAWQNAVLDLEEAERELVKMEAGK